MLTHAGTQELVTERMLLRPFRRTDAQGMHKNWAADKKVQHRYGEPVYPTLAEVNGLLDKYLPGYQRKDYYRWAILEQESGECIGQIAYFLVDSSNHFAEIEYCIGRAYQGKGLATEAARAIITYGFERINLHKVQICHNSLNMPSKRVIEKCGFVYEGTLRDFFFIEGGYADRLYYSILRSEYTRF